MESNNDTNNNLTENYERTIIRNIILNIRTHQIYKALKIIEEFAQDESIIKSVHDYLLGLNCRYPFIKYDNIIQECGLYNVFISKLDFEMYNDSTTLSNCPCGSLVCTNWKYFTRPDNEVWTLAPMEFFTNEYFQEGFMEKFKFCSHK